MKNAEFGRKWAIFRTYFFQAIYANKMGFWFWVWFWSKLSNFSKLFLLANIGHENVFYDIVKRKKAFVGYKNKKFRKSKIDIFSKGLVHGSGQKLKISQTLIFMQNRPRKSI